MLSYFEDENQAEKLDQLQRAAKRVADSIEAQMPQINEAIINLTMAATFHFKQVAEAFKSFHGMLVTAGIVEGVVGGMVVKEEAKKLGRLMQKQRRRDRYCRMCQNMPRPRTRKHGGRWPRRIRKGGGR